MEIQNPKLHRFLMLTFAKLAPRLGQRLAMNSPQRSLEAD